MCTIYLIFEYVHDDVHMMDTNVAIVCKKDDPRKLVVPPTHNLGPRLFKEKSSWRRRFSAVWLLF